MISKYSRRFLLSLFASIMMAASLLSGCATPSPVATPPLPTATSTIEPAASPTATAIVQPQVTPTEVSELGIGFLASPVPARHVGFATYSSLETRTPDAYAGYSLPVELNEAVNLDRFLLSQSQQGLLAQNGFVVAPAEYREFFQLYEEARYEALPIFVTTDSVFHVYHLLFDKVLRTLEDERFHADLVRLSEGMLWAAQSQYETLQGTDLEEAARRNVAYFAVANRLLDSEAEIPELVKDEVEAELALIEAHEGFVLSPILGYPEDYSQYVPRGHYAKNETRQRYFKAMMWYGRINFRLKEEVETLSALLIAQALANTEIAGEPASRIWERIYEPTSFFVGVSDDLDIYDYHPLIEEVYGSMGNDPTIFADEEKLTQFIQAARQLPPPQINSMWVYIWEDRDEATQGFRFMGQRFVIDAYIFQQLMFRNVGTLDDPRMLPKGLDIFAAMGSEEAYGILDEMDETHYENYDQQMTKIRGEIAALEIDSWTQNLYWAWLYSFQPLIEVKYEGYPAFMRNTAWTRKDLHTALGSWTELKHDTILYAKQAYAELGGGHEELEVHGYVEPNPEAYARLAALTRMTIDGLEERGLLSEGDKNNLERLETILFSLKGIAEKELEGTPLSQEEQDLITFYGGTLEMLTIAAADQEEEVEGRSYLEDEQAAVIADVATDPLGTVLEEGVGRIFEIYVLVGVEGQLVITKGGVFSYYEFPWPMGDRLTDEAWREMLDSGQAPDRPDWTESFVAQ